MYIFDVTKTELGFVRPEVARRKACERLINVLIHRCCGHSAWTSRGSLVT